jgi:hypothetical protein
MNMNHMNFELPPSDRIDALVRRAGMERSLYLGEALGHTLGIAWNALESVGAWMWRALPRARSAHKV